jgi:putative membrane protein insertion efficiency factor
VTTELSPSAAELSAPSSSSPPSSVSRLVRLIEWYQRSMEGRPSPCRFTPSCSAYAHEALVVHGRRRGLWLTVRRLARCRPFGPSGFDPVPDPPLPAPPPKD